MIPPARPFIDSRELGAVRRVLKSGWLTQGPEVARFEAAFAGRLGVAHAVAVNSAASALQISIEALRLDGEIILPSMTFVASANAILHAGCTPVFADIDYQTNNLDPEAVEAAITPRTCAIMPVHFGGLSCDMTRIGAISRRHRLALIEDSAEAIGATCRGRQAGSFGLGCFSFFPTKNLTTGEGGMVTTSNARLAERLRGLRAHGVTDRARRRVSSTPRHWRRTAEMVGYNFRMSDILAAVGRVQLSKLERMNRLRQRHAAYLNTRLSPLGVQVPESPPGFTHVYQMYTIKVDPAKTRRDTLIASLRRQGVGASVHFDPPVHRHPPYRRFKPPHPLRNTNLAARSLVSLPMYPALTTVQLNRMVGAVETALIEARR